MTLSVDQLRVTSFETAAVQEAAALPQYTPPEPDCYSPYCYPTQLQEQCPETTRQTGLPLTD